MKSLKLVVLCILLITLSVFAAEERQITFYPGMDYHAKWSPDGNKIVFTSWRGNSIGLWMYDIAGDSIYALPTGMTGDHYSNWHPSGEFIFFDAYGVDGRSDIFKIPATGGEPVNVTASSMPDVHPNISPDGMMLLFGFGENLYKKDLQTSTITQITSHSGDEFHSHWSPVGDKIVFECDHFGSRDIGIVSANGGAITYLTQDNFNNSHPRWSPDGMRILFTSNREGTDNIYVMPDTGGTPTRLTPVAGAWADWSPDGSQIVYASKRNDTAYLFILPLEEHKCGDANGDGTVNIGDAVFVINFIFRNGPTPVPPLIADANGDESVNIGDVVYTISYIFSDGPPPQC